MGWRVWKVDAGKWEMNDDRRMTDVCDQTGRTEMGRGCR